MTDRTTRTHPPLTLIANSQEWHSRSLESILGPHGYAVLRAYTGKQAIDYSGGVSAEDNLGIGGYGRVMGPNGEAQYWAPSLPAACNILFEHYAITYRAPGERWPRRERRRPGCGWPCAGP